MSDCRANQWRMLDGFGRAGQHNVAGVNGVQVEISTFVTFPVVECGHDYLEL